MARKNYVLSSPGFVVDPESVQLNSGRQVDFALIAGAGYGTAGERRVKAGAVVSEIGSGKIIPRTDRRAASIDTTAGGVATATLNGHGFSVGDTVVISSASSSGLNGEWVIDTVPDANTFTFDGAPASLTDATGDVAAKATGILVAAADEDADSDSKSGYGVYVGGVFYETLLPDDGDAEIASIKSELGSRFVFDKYEDNRS